MSAPNHRSIKKIEGSVCIERAARLSSIGRRASVRSLVIRTGGGLGDTVLSEPALQILRAAFPTATMHVMLPPIARQLSQMGFPGDHFPRFASRRSCRNRFAAYDLALDLDPMQYSQRLHLKLASGTDLFCVFGKPVRGSKRMPVYERIRRTMAHIGVKYPPVLPKLTIPKVAVRWVERWLRAEEIDPSRTLTVVIQPGSSWIGKQWMPERFAAVAESLIASYQAEVILLTGPLDKTVSDEVLAAVHCTGHIHIAARWPLTRVAALLARSAFFIGNDSGMAHVAAALARPVVVIFGPTNGHVWGAATDRALVFSRIPCRCPDPDQCDRKCLRGVTVPEVVGAAEALISEVIGRDTYPALDPICVASSVVLEKGPEDCIRLQNPEWEMTMEIGRGFEYVAEVLRYVEATHSARQVIQAFPDASSLLAQLLRHGLVVPCAGKPPNHSQRWEECE